MEVICEVDVIFEHFLKLIYCRDSIAELMWWLAKEPGPLVSTFSHTGLETRKGI